MATLSAINQSVTVGSPGPISPTNGVSTAATQGNWTLCIECLGLTPGASCSIQVQESMDNWATILPMWVFCFTGEIGGGSGTFSQGSYCPSTLKESVVKYQVEQSYIGSLGALLRTNLTSISSGAVTVSSWFELS